MTVTDIMRREDAALTTSPTVADLVKRSETIQHVLKHVMKEGVHYGTIPGTQKPTLYQPGAEKLMTLFQLAADLYDEDLSVPGEYRHRVTAKIRHIPTGEIVSTGLGEASTNEEKYQWREAVCDEEWEETLPERRRVKWKKGQYNPRTKRREGPTSVKQVRTEPADLANTALKMAAKRAVLSGARSAVAASDAFAVDMDELVQAGIEIEGEETTPRTVQEPQAKPAEKAEAKPATNGKPASNGSAKKEPAGVEDRAPEALLQKANDRWHDKGTISEAQTKRLFAIAYKAGWKSDDISSFLAAKFASAPDEIPWGDPYNAIVEIFETTKPGDWDMTQREPGADDEIPFDE